MKHKKYNIIILMIFLAVFLFGFWQSCQAVDLLIKPYPTFGGEQLTGESTLPQVVKYIYLFALGTAGVVALLAILIGAIMYIFSAGNPSKAADAKDRITSALLGILILLASVLLLRIINPDLVKIGFELPKIEGENIPQETKNIACYCLSEGGNEMFAGSCYSDNSNCLSACTTICGNLDKIGFCKKDVANCQ